MGTRYVKPTLETDTVALQAVHGLSKEILPCGSHSGDIVLFPFNGSIDVFEDLLNGVGNFSSDTVTRNQGNLCHIESSLLHWKTTQIVAHGINTPVLGRKLHVTSKLVPRRFEASGEVYPLCYSRETGSEGRGRSLEMKQSGRRSRGRKVFKLTPGAMIDLEEPARALRSMVCRMDGGERKARNGRKDSKNL